MSRILRRPMFRGGPVSSYGTGIASGLADGGRVGFRNGGSYAGNQGTVLGSDLMNFVKQNPKYGSLDFANTLDPKQFYSKPTGTYEIGRAGPKIENSPEFLKLFQNYMDPETTLIDPDKIDVETGLEIDEVGSVTGSVDEGSEGAISNTSIKEPIKHAPLIGITTPEKGNVNNQGKVIEPPESYEINADDVKAQAALFDRLLNEDYEKDKQSAQIGDASDYALKFFQSTVGEGKAMKEAAGDVAGYALEKPSRTEKVQEGKKKTKQTATVMAINEALASNKSDRELDKMFAKMGLDEGMRKRLLVERINLETAVARGMSIRKRVNADKSSGTSDMNKLRNHTKGFAEDFEKINELPTGSVEVTSFLTEKKEGSKLPLYTDKKVLLVEENKNQIFIDEATKRVYQVVEDTNGNLTFKTLAQ